MTVQQSSSRRRSWLRIVAVLVAVGLVAVACGDDSSDEPRTATIALPFASCLSFYPVYMAEGRGYFDALDVQVTIEAADGSVAANQAVLTGQADIALTAPPEFLRANEEAELQSVYAIYQEDTFAVYAPADGDIETASDLAGKTVGYSTESGGDFSFMRAFLGSAAGLVAGEDYEQLAVGDGANYALALRDESVDAFSGSFFVEVIVEGQGQALHTLTDPNWQRHPDIFFVAEKEWIDDNKGTVEAIGRATAMGAEWGAANPEAGIDICSDFIPEETQDPVFARDIYDRMTEILTLPASADGKWGFSDIDVMEIYLGNLEAIDEVPAGSTENVESLFTNDFVDEYNDFDESDL